MKNKSRDNDRQFNDVARKMAECKDGLENLRVECKEEVRKAVIGLEASLNTLGTDLKIMVSFFFFSL